MASAMPQARVEHDTRAVGHGRGTGGRQGLAGQRGDAPSEARGADGSRAGRHPPAYTATRRRRCGGRRRVRRARAGFEIDHSEPSGSRVAISRAAGPDGARNTRGATSNTSRKATAHRHTQRPEPTAPATPVGPQATTQHRGAGPQARAPSATTQTRTLRSTCVRSRSARAARRWRRSSRSPRLRRRAGPRR